MLSNVVAKLKHCFSSDDSAVSFLQTKYTHTDLQDQKISYQDPQV